MCGAQHTLKCVCNKEGLNQAIYINIKVSHSQLSAMSSMDSKDRYDWCAEGMKKKADTQTESWDGMFWALC